MLNEKECLEISRKAELLENAKLGYLNLKTKAIEKGEHNPEVELVLDIEKV